MIVSRCKGCGAKIIWARTHSDKRVPLDAVALVFEVTEMEGGRSNPTPLVRSTADKLFIKSEEGNLRAFMVSHFATCPKASEFSGRGKKGR